jgi:hypothetical protein
MLWKIIFKNPITELIKWIMNPNRIKKRNFNGEILISEKLNPDLIDILTSKDNLLIIAHGKPPYKVAIGVPHQAAIGEANICEKNKQRDSDENAASYALVAFSKLKNLFSNAMVQHRDGTWI